MVESIVSNIEKCCQQSFHQTKSSSKIIFNLVSSQITISNSQFEQLNSKFNAFTSFLALKDLLSNKFSQLVSHYSQFTFSFHENFSRLLDSFNPNEMKEGLDNIMIVTDSEFELTNNKISDCFVP
jgi:hypothetical protein